MFSFNVKVNTEYFVTILRISKMITCDKIKRRNNLNFKKCKGIK